MKKIITLLITIANFAMASQAQIGNVSYKKGLSFTDDSTFKVKINFRIQTLLETNFASNGKDASTKFLTRRSRIKFNGYAFNPKFVYKFELGMSNRDIGNRSDEAETNNGSRLILDAVVKYKHSKNISFWFGQTKLPGNRERVISSGSLQFVDRSLVNSRYNIDRGSGIQIHTKHKLGKQSVMKLAGAWSMGEGRNITANNAGGFEYTGRVEFLPFGEFAKKGDYFAADLARESKPKLAISVAYDYNEDASRQRGNLGSFKEDTATGERIFSDLNTLFVDMHFKYKGFSLMSEYANKTGNGKGNNVAAKDNFTTGTGLNVQAGYLFKNNFEVATRYTTINRDEDFSSVVDSDEYTLGISKYISGHRLKFQSDFSYVDVDGNDDPGMRFRFQVEIGF
jgi:phosphate-selective porin OprO/OprP